VSLPGDMEHFFAASFEALTGHKPLRWQLRLFERLAERAVPRVCDLPTGLGKTSVIVIWLIALAAQARAERITLPRRLVYIVNRRTVVDQATSVVEQLRLRLLCPQRPEWSRHTAVLCTLAEILRSLGSSDHLFLAVSTLRGELADNEEWKADPARAAIIIGTIDMIGSKLLFSGYGDGSYWRPQHAGLVGQDSLIVHDEAHLTPAFSSEQEELISMKEPS
jgi:CRISPR-associated endonuclease/helicase Cas3